jgi:hypothetical protein
MDLILTLFSLFIFLILIINFKEITIFILEFLNKINYKIINYLQTNEDVKLGSVIYDEKGRFLEFLIENTSLLPHKKALQAIYNKLLSNKEFLSFGSKKVIILFSKFEDGSTITFHPNVFITNNTPFDIYYKSIENYIQVTYDGTTLYGNIDQIKEFKLLVWNLDKIENKDIKLTLNHNYISIRNKVFKRNFSTSISFKGRSK